MAEPAIKVIKKKVQPYPIPVQLTGPSGVIKAQIIKLVLKGFIVNLQGNFVHVHDNYQIAFEIPVVRYTVNSNVVVIKTYDRSSPKRAIERLAEAHFLGLSDMDKKNIYTFLRAIKQADE